MSKALKTSLVCPYLFNLVPSDLSGPLVQFNAAKAEEEDTRKLILTINEAQEFPLEPATIKETFDIWWPKLAETLERLKNIELAPKSERPQREILLEILELVRNQTRSETVLAAEEIDSTPFQEILEFAVGSYVHHQKYGRGLVLRRETRGSDSILTVSFPEYGQKRLVQRFANLTRG